MLIAYVFHGDQRPGSGQGKTFSKKCRKVKKLYFVREIVRLWEMSRKSEIPSERNSFSLSWPLLYESWQRLTFCDVNVTREYCSVYLIDPGKHTVSVVMQARVGLAMKLFTYLFLFSQFFNIQKVFGAIHPTWNMLVWKDIFYSLHDNWLMLGFQENQRLFSELPVHIHCMWFAENKENKFVGRVAGRRGWRPFLGPILY